MTEVLLLTSLNNHHCTALCVLNNQPCTAVCPGMTRGLKGILREEELRGSGGLHFEGSTTGWIASNLIEKSTGKPIAGAQRLRLVDWNSQRESPCKSVGCSQNVRVRTHGPMVLDC